MALNSKHDHAENTSGTFRVTIFGAIVNAVLSVVKITGGLLAGSTALISDGIHSTSDILTDVMVFLSIHHSAKPADKCHPFGHRRYQSLSSLFIGLLLGLAGVYMLYQCVVSFNKPSRVVTGWLAFYIACASIVLKEVLFRVTYRVGKKYDDRAVMANAWHHRSDAFSSVAAAAGIGGAQLGGPQWYFLDPLTGAVLSTYIVVTAWKIGRESWNELADTAPNQEVMDRIREDIGQIPEVRDYHAVRARTMGGLVDMDLHVLVDPRITVDAGHDIATRVKEKIMQSNQKIKNVVVHIEPDRENVD